MRGEHPRSSDRGADADLSTFVEDVRAELASTPPQATAGADWVAVVEHAHLLDPVRVREADVAAAVRDAPPWEESAPQLASGDPELDAFVAAARADVMPLETSEGGASERARETPARDVVPRRGAWVAGLAAMAAVVALLLWGARWGRAVAAGSATADTSAAMFAPLPEALRVVVSHRRGMLTAAREGGQEASAGTDASAQQPSPPAPAHSRELSAPERTTPRTARVREPLTDRLDRLELEANAAWKGGELAKATRIYRKIIKLDKSGNWAQPAYGDLFTLHRRQQVRLRKLWASYLVGFPTGSFADDARAGLCRTALETERDACWRRYLADMPRGSFRVQAKRALLPGKSD